MRKLFCVGALAVILGLAPTPARADSDNQNGYSLGLILGDPTGLTLRGGLGGRNAFQVHFGFSPFPGDAVALMADWTYDLFDFAANSSDLKLPLYIGAGGKVQWFSGRYYAYEYNKQHYLPDFYHFGLGARGLVGLRASLLRAPFDLFIELAPIGILVVIPNPGFFYDIDVALGARYRF